MKRETGRGRRGEDRKEKGYRNSELRGKDDRLEERGSEREEKKNRERRVSEREKKKKRKMKDCANVCF